MAKQIIVLNRESAGRWQILYWVAVPAARQSFYAVPGAKSAWAGAVQGENDAIAAGQVKEVSETYSIEGTPVLGEVQAALETRWAALQAEVNSHNPWIRYGSYWDGASWTLGGVS